MENKQLEEIRIRVELVAHRLGRDPTDIYFQLPHLLDTSATLNSFELLSFSELSQYIDHTNLRANATTEDITRTCQEAIDFGFYCVCVNLSRVPCAIAYLNPSFKNSSNSNKQASKNNVKVACVIGFPLGATSSSVKVFEATEAVSCGADELDMVLNIGKMRDGDYKAVLDEIQSISEATKSIPLKVILETSLLSREEVIDACILSVLGGAQFVKTSTGFSGGAKVEDVQLMKSVVGRKVLVKASGGIRSYEDAIAMIRNGASRIGTSSSVSILEGFRNHSNPEQNIGSY